VGELVGGPVPGLLRRGRGRIEIVVCPARITAGDPAWVPARPSLVLPRAAGPGARVHNNLRLSDSDEELLKLKQTIMLSKLTRPFVPRPRVVQQALK
jgi:hypothetical protein